MVINSILKQQLEKISLSSSEESNLKKLSDEVINKITKAGGNAKLGGSLAKKTVVRKDKQDIDIFVLFKSEDKTKDLKKILNKAKFKTKTIHGSRDYFQFKKQNILFEIIPVIKLSHPEQAENVTDVSLTHVNYIKKQTQKNPKLSNEIKLAKSFCHANNCYGAESYIQGFSGYALEVLISNFKSFTNFLKKINQKKVIDPENHFKNENHALGELNESKLQSPLILIDPTYKYRNVTAGLSSETFEKFKKAANKFLKSPSLSAFEKKQFNLKQFKKSKGTFIKLELKTSKQEGDIAGTKMKKFFRFIINKLEKKQQKVLKSEFIYPDEGQTSQAYLIIKQKPQIERKGPQLIMKQAVKAFKKSNKTTFTKNQFIYTKEKISLKEIFNSSKRVAEEMQVEFKTNS